MSKVRRKRTLTIAILGESTPLCSFFWGGGLYVVSNLVTPEERRERQRRIKAGKYEDGDGEDRRRRNKDGSPRNE